MADRPADPDPAVLDAASTLAALAPPWPEPLADAIAAAVDADGRCLVVLDDDPTGTQTVHGVAVLTSWELDELTVELARSRCFFVLTNSRSLASGAARALATEIGTNLRLAAAAVGREVAVISRSDSTLRGHFPVEVDALAEALGADRFDATVVAPWFLDGGRLTLDGVHYARSGDELVPVGHTEFARDASFGYRSSRLAEWIEEKTSGAVRAEDVTHLSLDVLRSGGPAEVTRRLLERPPGGYVTADAVEPRDVEVMVAGLLGAEAAGRRYLYRTAASFVRVRAAIAPKALLPLASIPSAAGSGRLLVVGSHVARSTEQLAQVLALPAVVPVELEVDAALADGAAEAARCAAAVDAALAEGHDVVLYTSRTLRSGADADASLAISARVSAALVAAVRGVRTQPRLLVAKGGITSSDVATEALAVRRAQVLGQVQAGVSVWELGPESRAPGMRYVVFPGNVGTAGSLAELFAPEASTAGGPAEASEAERGR